MLMLAASPVRTDLSPGRCDTAARETLKHTHSLGTGGTLGPGGTPSHCWQMLDIPLALFNGSGSLD